MEYLQSNKLKRQVFCYTKVHSIVDHKQKKEYKSAVERLGMMIYNNGLVSALCILKDEKDKYPLYNHLSIWIANTKVIGFNLNTSNPDLLVNVLAISNSMVLQLLTIEVNKLSDTLKEIIKSESWN